SYGRLYGILFFENRPVSLDEIVEESGYAKSTVSTAMKRLEQFHVVHRRSIPGEGKKAFYEAETDLWRIVQEFLRREVQRELDIMTRALESAENRLEGVDDERASEDLERIRSFEKTYKRGQKVVDIFVSVSNNRLIKLIENL
ncbi:GbsR/MarR family transcriptional regulator, partial [Haladaptatus sp.]|uniref:GbsR/MarR family transcriptional regulator n=1 Tax=Haladaptatus sp. TaxID=1973141 RepID=UPI003C663A63